MAKYKYTEESKAKMLEWADILDSGKYKQHFGGWGGDDCGAYCCLSVAYKHFTGKDLMYMPVIQKVREPAELFNQSQNWCNQFIDMNDKDGLTFPEIATKIREMVA